MKMTPAFSKENNMTLASLKKKKKKEYDTCHHSTIFFKINKATIKQLQNFASAQMYPIWFSDKKLTLINFKIYY